MPIGASPGEALFSVIRRNFEHANTCGTVLVISEQPRQDFFITVENTSVSYSQGTIPNPAATIFMRANVLLDLLSEANSYDTRDVKFSSRLAFSGNLEIANIVLDLAKTPSPITLATLGEAKEKTRRNPITAVPRVPYPDRKYLTEAMQQFRPVVMTGLLDDWRFWEWSPTVLHNYFGDAKIAPFFPGAMRDFVSSMMSSENRVRGLAPKYTGGIALPPMFWQHFPPPALFAGMINSAQFWLGSAISEQAVTGLHCDCKNGILCQVFGTKRVVFYSPDQEDLLYARRAFNTYRPCWTGPDKPDYENYPLFKQARPIAVTLTPGDVLFVPVGWFHCVFALEPVMSISFVLVESPSNSYVSQNESTRVKKTNDAVAQT